MSTKQDGIAWSPSMSRRKFLASLAAGSVVLAGSASGAVRRLVGKSPLPFEPDLFVDEVRPETDSRTKYPIVNTMWEASTPSPSPSRD